jgi:hypothetical protein
MNTPRLCFGRSGAGLLRRAGSRSVSCANFGVPVRAPIVFRASMIRIIISQAETLEYYHVRHSLRIYQQQIYLHALTGTSVVPQIFHFSVTPSKLKQVLEY